MLFDGSEVSRLIVFLALYLAISFFSLLSDGKRNVFNRYFLGTRVKSTYFAYYLSTQGHLIRISFVSFRSKCQHIKVCPSGLL